MSLSRIQRAAMARAQKGDWKLADAMELLAPGRRHFEGEALLFGVHQGGRLQAFAYGVDHTDYKFDTDDIDSFSCVIRYVVNLNGEVLFDHEQDDCPPFGTHPDISLAAAYKVVHDFESATEKPTQNTLIQEAA